VWEAARFLSGSGDCKVVDSVLMLDTIHYESVRMIALSA
jgi:hypothetical protein